MTKTGCGNGAHDLIKCLQSKKKNAIFLKFSQLHVYKTTAFFRIFKNLRYIATVFS